MDKKGVLGMEALTALAWGLIVFAMIIGVGIVVLVNMGDASVICANVGNGVSTWNRTSAQCENANGCANTATYSGGQCSGDAIINSTITLNDTYHIPTPLATFTGVVLSSVIVTNASDTANVVPSSNYSISGGSLKINKTSAFNETEVNVSASYSYDETLYTIAGAGQTYTNVIYMSGQLGQSGLAGWIPAVIAISVGLLFLGAFMLGNRSKRR